MDRKPRQLHLLGSLPRDWFEEQQDRHGEVYLDDRHFDQCVRAEPADIFKPDGTLLCSYRPGALQRSLCNQARPALRRAGSPYDTDRGLHTGVIGFNVDRKNGPARIGPTAFTKHRLDDWGQLLEPIWRLDEVYREAAPEHHAYQQQMASRANPGYIIARTVFSTGVVNRWSDSHRGRTHLHTDSQDVPGTLVALVVVAEGSYRGGETIFPEYGVAVDVRCGDVLLADPHELHCNSPIEGQPGWERLAMVVYLKQSVVDWQG